MIIAIAGSKGLLGSELKKQLLSKNFNILDLNKPDIDITDHNQVEGILKNNKDIKILFNCTAYTDVPKAEIEKELANDVNNKAVGNLAKICADANIHLFHFSTDFVFNGESNTPYLEESLTDPLNYYGFSKLKGEEALINCMQSKNKSNYTIFRVQWLYGDNDKNFFKKILKVVEDKKSIKLVSDEIGSPCSVSFLSNYIIECLNISNFKMLEGQIINLTHDNYCSRYECGKYFLDKIGQFNIEELKNSPPSSLRRPKYGALDNSKIKKILKKSLGTWQEDLDNYINKIKVI